MKVIIWGEGQQAQDLKSKVFLVIDELGLSEFIKVEETVDAALKSELSISEESALIIEEESISFKDMIFEGMVPEESEIKSMFVSIIGGPNGGANCAPGGCGS